MRDGSASAAPSPGPDCDTRETVTKRSPGFIGGSYGSIMKNIKVLSPLLMSLLLASVALAQAGSPDAPDTPQPQPSVAAQPEPTPVAGTGASGEDKLISQARQYPRGPRGRMGPSARRCLPGVPASTRAFARGSAYRLRCRRGGRSQQLRRKHRGDSRGFGTDRRRLRRLDRWSYRRGGDPVSAHAKSLPAVRHRRR